MNDLDSNSQIMDSQFTRDENEIVKEICELFEVSSRFSYLFIITYFLKEDEEESLDRAIRNLEVHVIKKIIVDLFVNEDDRMYAISNAIFERKIVNNITLVRS